MKRAISLVTAVTMAILFAFSSSSCESSLTQKENSRVFYEYFDTWGTLYDYSGAAYEEFSVAADEVEKILKDYHELCDIYNTYEGKNNLATLNAMAGKGPVKLDARLVELLLYSKEIYYLTNGEMNVAFGAVLEIWHEFRKYAEDVPSYEILLEANKHTDIEKMIIDQERGTVELLDPEMSLDVGAIAKGYAVEEVAKYLESNGLTSFVLDMGGNLRAIGTKKDGSPWRAGVLNPFKEGEYAGYYDLADMALVTSGNYERFYTVDGVRYHHIIDEDTLFPKNIYASVSVKAPSSALADSLSTAFFNMEIEEIEAALTLLQNVSVLLIESDGKITELGNKQ